jgi:hypothetical protein
MGTSGLINECFFPIFEHVHDITDLPKSNAEGSAFLIQRSGLRYRRADSYSRVWKKKGPAPAKAEHACGPNGSHKACVVPVDNQSSEQFCTDFRDRLCRDLGHAHLV